MNLNSIPPLISSDNGPVILGPRRTQFSRGDSVYSKSRATFSHKSTSPTFDNFDNNSDDVMDDVASFNQRADENQVVKEAYESDGSVMHACEGNMLIENITGGNNVRGEIPHILYSDCCLKRCQSCYAIVRKDTSALTPKNEVRLSTNSFLPGGVDIDELINEPDHRKQTFSYRISRFWNANLQLTHSKQYKKFVDCCHHYLLQMRKFISKLQQVNREERLYADNFKNLKFQYLQHQNEQKAAFTSYNKMYDTEASNYFNSDDESQLPVPDFHLRPAKLGKVYAELQVHFKTWKDIVEKWNTSRLDLDAASLQLLTRTKKRIRAYQLEMLMLSEQLIKSRLNSFACCVAIYSCIEEFDREWDYALGPGCLKRLCKLVEVYNKLLKQHHGVSQHQSSISIIAETLPNFQEKSWNPSSGVLKVYDVARILSILSAHVKQELASSLLHVLSVVQQPKTSHLQQYEQQMLGRTSNFTELDWKAANSIDTDVDNVITHVAGYEVINIANTALSNDHLSAIKQLLYAQGSFIYWFMNSLAANTSLLRSNVQSKSSKSVVSLQTFSDDITAISSDDETSSVSSSLIFSQLSSTTPANCKRRKTVLWRDSWDQEAVESASKSYMASIVIEGPYFLLSQIENPNLEVTQPHSFKGQGHHDLSPLSVCFRPRFNSDVGALLMDAIVWNMMTLDVLPQDLLSALQKSTQTLVIEKVFATWDSYLSLALGTSTNDKCASLLMEDKPSVTKTAWIFIKAIHALLYVMNKYHKREDVVKNALARLEATLDSFYHWCHSKIQQFVSTWRLRELMQVTLGDLSQITRLALTGLPMVEKCHNYVESRRMELPGTLQMATRQLRNIDAIITDMQSLSGYCMKSYTKKCAYLSKQSIEVNFPSSKTWKQKYLTDHGSASRYIETSVKNVLSPICSSVCFLKPRSQLAAVQPAVTAIIDAVIRLILQRAILFSIQGTMQLQRDFDFIIDYVCSEEARLCLEVRRAVPRLKSVERAVWVVNTLQRTDFSPSNKSEKKNYQKSRRKAQVRSMSPEDLVGGQEDNDWTLKEREFLALRAHVGRKKRWIPLPCSDLREQDD